MLKKILISAIAASCINAAAMDLPTRKINGTEYYYYQVKAGDTVYSLTHTLGISRDQIVKHNPSASDGLRQGDTLLFPVSEFKDINPGMPATHTVTRGETIYGIAHKYGVSPEAIIALNPQAENGVRTHMVLTLPAPGVTPARSEETKPATVDTKTGDKRLRATEETSRAGKTMHAKTYTIAKGDTFYGIAHNNGLTVDRLSELNPFVDPDDIKPGTVLRLTDDAPVVMNIDNDSRRLSDPNPGIVEVTPDTTPDLSRGMTETARLPQITSQQTILVLLPFMTEKETPSRHAQFYTEFYKGLLVAADSLSHVKGAPVKIIALDTSNDPERARQQLNNVSPEDISVIIGPEDDAQLKAISDFALANGVFALNIFNIKDESYKTNPFMIQGNINQRMMYRRALSAIEDRYPDFTPVILSLEDSRAEKTGFTDMVTQAYAAKGKPVRTINYNGYLTAADLETFAPDSSYVFIPTSGSRADFNKFAHAIKKFKENRTDPASVAVFGYPDWTAFRGNALDDLHLLDAVIYSRFFLDSTLPQSVYANNSYRRWFGEEMAEVVPSQGMLGFDTGCFLITALRRNGGDFDADLPTYGGFSGSQSSFRFTEPDSDEGYINNALYIVRFRPDGTYDTVVI